MYDIELTQPYLISNITMHMQGNEQLAEFF